MSAISQAQEKFGELIQSEFERIERMKQDTEVKDFSKLDKIVVASFQETVLVRSLWSRQSA